MHYDTFLPASWAVDPTVCFFCPYGHRRAARASVQRGGIRYGYCKPHVKVARAFARKRGPRRVQTYGHHQQPMSNTRKSPKSRYPKWADR